MKGSSADIVIKNKIASHDFEFIEKFIAGIQLYGTEIKSIRLGKATIADTYCIFSFIFINVFSASIGVVSFKFILSISCAISASL